MRRALIRTFILTLLFLLAAAGGYLLSARVGTEALRVEVEKQLEGIFFGEVSIGRTRLVIRGGLYLEGEDIWVYRWQDDRFVGGLHAPRAVAEIDPFALILGRFRLLYLMADGLEFHIERQAESVYAPPPLQWLEDRRLRTAIPGDLERNLAFWNTVESVTRTLLTKPTVARKVEVRNGRVTWRDALHRDVDGQPIELELVGVEGHLTHHWLSGDAELDVDTRLLRRSEGPDAPGHPIHIEGTQDGGDDMRLLVRVQDVPADLLGMYVQPGGFDYEPRGGISGDGHFRTSEPGHGQMRIDWQVDDFSARLPTHGRPLAIASDALRVQGEADLHPGRFRLEGIEFWNDRVGARVAGQIERPLRMSSQLDVEAEVTGIDLGHLRVIAKSLPGEASETFVELFARAESGRLPEVSGRGGGRLADWDKLLDGRLSHLPDAFLFEALVEQFKIGTGGRGWIEDLAGRLALEGDTLRADGVRAVFDDSPLPEIGFELSGISHLFRNASADRALTSEASGLPGLDALFGLLASEDPKSEARFPATRIVIDSLEHPMLRWPVRDARVQLHGEPEGLTLDIEEAIWAGVPVEGRARWLAWPDRRMRIDLTVIPPDATASQASSTSNPKQVAEPASTPRVEPDVTTAIEGAASMQWASGRFELDRLDGGFLPMKAVQGQFALQGQDLLISKARADLEPRGKLIADVALSLGDPEQVPVQLNFSIVSADLERFATGIGLPEKSVDGTLHLTGALDGPMRPQTPLLALLQGEISLDARAGEIYRRLPLIVALAQASEGLRSIEERNSSVTYEFMKAELALDRGRVTTSDFRVEGPIRIYGSGRLDPLRTEPDNELIVAIFLFRQANALLGGLPVVRMLLPGSQKGLIGAYFEVTGDFSDPNVRPLPARSIAEDLPDAMTAPFKVIQALLGTPNRRVAPEP